MNRPAIDFRSPPPRVYPDPRREPILRAVGMDGGALHSKAATPLHLLSWVCFFRSAAALFTLRMREAARLGAQYELAVCTDLLSQDVGIWLRIHQDFATSAENCGGSART
jgi:hypothetical protein